MSNMVYLWIADKPIIAAKIRIMQNDSVLSRITKVVEIK